MDTQPLPAGRPRRAALFPTLTEAVRRDILAMVRGLPDEELLELVGDRLADLVARRGAAPLAREEKPEPAPPHAAPARRGRPPRRPAPTCAPTPEATPTPEAAEDEPLEARAALLPWPRSAEDGAPLGIDLAGAGKLGAMASDVRRLTLSRYRGPAAALLDADELVQEVYAAILRRNRLPCAFDPRKGSLGTYVYRVAGSVIANMLEAHRRARREALGGDEERSADDELADTRDPIGAFELADAALDAGVDLDATREASALVTKPVRALWERALERRRTEQAAELAEEQKSVAELALDRLRAAQLRPTLEAPSLSLGELAAELALDRLHPGQRRAALDAEILEYIRAETEAGRPVFRAELAAMLGMTTSALRYTLERLEEAGAVDARRQRRGRPVAYWARSAPAPELPPEAPAPSSGELAAPSAPELAEEPPVALEPLSAEEPPPAPAPPSPPAPAPLPRRRLIGGRLHVAFHAAVVLAAAAPSALAG